MTAVSRPATSLASRGARQVATWFGGYALLVVAVATLGGYVAMHPAMVGVTVAAATAALTASYFAVPSVQAFAGALGPYGLAWMHVWRIPAGLAFLAWGMDGALPPLFAALAGVGDVLAGLFAAALLVLPRRRGIIAAFHVFGFADFAVAVSTGLWFNLTGHPLMGAIEVLPLALIPLVGVPLSGATHAAALHLLWTGRRAGV